MNYTQVQMFAFQNDLLLFDLAIESRKEKGEEELSKIDFTII
jgi:hypothetical protein